MRSHLNLQICGDLVYGFTGVRGSMVVKGGYSSFHNHGSVKNGYYISNSSDLSKMAIFH